MKREIIDASQLELVDQVVDIKRVTKVVKGGRNMRFTALVVVGDKNGHVGAGLPFATASIFTPKVSSSFVFLYKRFLSASTSAPFLSSKTILIPSFDDWLVISTISVVAFDSTSE